MKSILVICIGNICRSPMAQGILQAKMPGVSVRSAGLGALVGHRADPFAVELMNDRGIDISEHIAQQLNGEMCRSAELILTMDSSQKKFIESNFSYARGKVFLLLDQGGGGVIPDPYRKSKLEFESSLKLIDEGISIWSDRIKKIISQQERQFT